MQVKGAPTGCARVNIRCVRCTVVRCGCMVAYNRCTIFVAAAGLRARCAVHFLVFKGRLEPDLQKWSPGKICGTDTPVDMAATGSNLQPGMHQKSYVGKK